MTPKDYMTTLEARRIAGVSGMTIRNWLQREPRLGVKVMGRWHVKPAVLSCVLNGQPLPDPDAERTRQEYGTPAISTP